MSGSWRWPPPPASSDRPAILSGASGSNSMPKLIVMPTGLSASTASCPGWSISRPTISRPAWRPSCFASPVQLSSERLERSPSAKLAWMYSTRASTSPAPTCSTKPMAIRSWACWGLSAPEGVRLPIVRATASVVIGIARWENGTMCGLLVVLVLVSSRGLQKSLGRSCEDRVKKSEDRRVEYPVKVTDHFWRSSHVVCPPR